MSGKILLITAGEVDNGITSKIDLETLKKTKKYFKNTLTIDMFLNSFYLRLFLFSDDNIHTLVLNEEFSDKVNKYTYLFIATALNSNTYVADKSD